MEWGGHTRMEKFQTVPGGGRGCSQRSGKGGTFCRLLFKPLEEKNKEE